MITLQKPRQSAPSDDLRGVSLLNRPILNKGTAFTEDERDRLGPHGLLPPQVESLDQQVIRADDLERHIYLRALQDANEVLFHRLLLDRIEEMTPIVYTPMVAQACEQFSHIRGRTRPARSCPRCGTSGPWPGRSRQPSAWRRSGPGSRRRQPRKNCAIG
jgi:malate dehydrogenase (oxaloacetate-decarboxylating)